LVYRLPLESSRGCSRAAPGTAPETSCAGSENQATRPSSQLGIVLGDSWSAPRFHLQCCVAGLTVMGLLRDLSPGLPAPRSRIMPLDQAASWGSLGRSVALPLLPPSVLLGWTHGHVAAPGMEPGPSRNVSENRAARRSSRQPSRRLGTQGLTRRVCLPCKLWGASSAARVLNTPGHQLATFSVLGWRRGH
jgi:hypothetical protein